MTRRIEVMERNAKKDLDALKGFDEITGLYTSRYFAQKAASGADVVVKVDGGYKIMTASEYNTWRKQK